MKEIKLSSGMTAMVDDEDFEYLNKWKWSSRKRDRDKTCYAFRSERINERSKSVSMHYCVFNPGEGKFIDHKDRNGLNNQKSNLRSATISENNRNQGKRRDSRHPYRGIKKSKSKGTKIWFARIRVGDKRFVSKSFKTPMEAAIEYNRMATKYHGEFAGLTDI